MARNRGHGDSSSGSSSRRTSRRTALLVAAGGLGAGGLYATGAFDVTEAIRRSDVGTVGDESALLGITIYSPSAQSGSTVTLMDFKNNTDVPLSSIDVLVLDSTNINLSNIDTPSSLAVGETGSVFADISCSSSATESVTLEIQVAGTGISIIAPRDVDISCTKLDPYDCHDIWEMACDYSEGGTLQLQNQSRDGSVCMDSSGGVTLEMQKGSRIESFARIVSGHDVDARLQEDSIIDGACAARGCGNVTAQLQGTGEGTGSEIKGDLCIRAGGNGTVQLQEGSIVGGDVKIDADGDTQVQIESGSSVEGTIDENWSSGWSNGYCSEED